MTAYESTEQAKILASSAILRSTQGFRCSKDFCKYLSQPQSQTPNTARNAVVGSGVIDADDVFARLSHTSVSLVGCGFAASVCGVGL